VLSFIKYTVSFPIKELKAAVSTDYSKHRQYKRGSQMEQAHLEEIEKIIYGLRLPKNSEYYEPGVGFSCKANDVGLDAYVECLEMYSSTCPFSVSYAHSYYCKCPSRIYIAKELKK
jgi:hypothetical protein